MGKRGVATARNAIVLKVGVNPELLKSMEAGIPLGRPGTPAEAAGAVYLLCTPESDYISGQVLLCSGGFSMWQLWGAALRGI